MITLFYKIIKKIETIIIKYKETISAFIEDTIINKLNGYYLQVYASGHTKLANSIIFLSLLFVNIMAFLHVIPSRIKSRNF